jgi:hypothetical protein
LEREALVRQRPAPLHGLVTLMLDLGQSLPEQRAFLAFAPHVRQQFCVHHGVGSGAGQ